MSYSFGGDGSEKQKKKRKVDEGPTPSDHQDCAGAVSALYEMEIWG